ncbi:hypothetical protein BC936DRAFT_139320 [Jimgerdemannia flammicorona]|uniref:Uncharacterized protein n=1 Tax=Jimgerdemannia flammicorona TaxID=994334 RepID=A0A433DMP0_9FUNG|nr:hypothetical protein BC936DRAFT_139320 [Jimgerdemannia flammicorona]
MPPKLSAANNHPIGSKPTATLGRLRAIRKVPVEVMPLMLVVAVGLSGAACMPWGTSGTPTRRSGIGSRGFNSEEEIERGVQNYDDFMILF